MSLAPQVAATTAVAKTVAGRLASYARVGLVLEPTPLHQAPRLSRELGVPVLLKRDDLTGVGLGGNKLRGLEYIIADALGQGCDCLVTGPARSRTGPCSPRSPACATTLSRTW